MQIVVCSISEFNSSYQKKASSSVSLQFILYLRPNFICHAVHCTIRFPLNLFFSMDKLYALMMMTYKYQLQLCNGPENIVFITLNHLDCIRKILPEDKKLTEFLDVAHRMVIVHFSTLKID